MSLKRLNPNRQDYHAISSLISHYNPNHSKGIKVADLEVPEPELCPKPHGAASFTYLAVPASNTVNNSFTSMSSRTEMTKRSVDGIRRSREATKRSVDYTGRSNSPYSSSRSVAQDMERILIVEQQIKSEKEKYRKLEKKYKELMTAQNQSQIRFENMVQELQRKLEEAQKGKISASSIMHDTSVIKQQLLQVEERLEGLFEYVNLNK